MARFPMGHASSPVLAEAAATTDTVYLLNKSLTTDSANGTTVEAPLSAIVALAGNVSKTGTPANNQLAVWTDANTVEGDGNLTWTGTLLTITGNLAVSGTLSFPANSIEVADVSGLQGALDGKQAADADLTAIAGLTSAADRVPYFTGSSTASLATFTQAGRDLVAGADAAAQRTTLALVPGTNVQAYDVDLLTLASAFTSAGGSAASLKLAEPTGAGSTGVLLTGPTTSAGDKAVTFQDVAGLVYVVSGQDVSIADGGTGLSTLPTGVLIGAGTGTITAKTAPTNAIVGNSGTPVNNQLAVWTDATTVEGDTNLTWSGALLTVTGNLTVSGTLSFPANSLEIADTSGLQTALDAKAPLAGSTFTGGVVLGSGASLDGGGKQIANHIVSVVPTVSGTLSITAHSGNVIVTSGDVTVPSTVGFHCTVVLGGAHRVIFANNGSPIQSAILAANDIVSVVVQTTTAIHAVRVQAANRLAFA